MPGCRGCREAERPAGASGAELREGYTGTGRGREGTGKGNVQGGRREEGPGGDELRPEGKYPEVHECTTNQLSCMSRGWQHASRW